MMHFDWHCNMKFAACNQHLMVLPMSSLISVCSSISLGPKGHDASSPADRFWSPSTHWCGSWDISKRLHPSAISHASPDRSWCSHTICCERWAHSIVPMIIDVETVVSIEVLLLLNPGFFLSVLTMVYHLYGTDAMLEKLLRIVVQEKITILSYTLCVASCDNLVAIDILHFPRQCHGFEWV